jgi:DNA-binding MarR family transcriptional regulator
MAMRDVTQRGKKACTQLELVLHMHGAFRRSLEPIRVTPLQAGVLLFLRGHENTTVEDAALAFLIRSSTMSVVVTDLVHKGWVIKRRADDDGRAVCLRLSQQGERLAVRIMRHIRDVKEVLSI